MSSINCGPRIARFRVPHLAAPIRRRAAAEMWRFGRAGRCGLEGPSASPQVPATAHKSATQRMRHAPFWFVPAARRCGTEAQRERCAPTTKQTAQNAATAAALGRDTADRDL